LSPFLKALPIVGESVFGIYEKLEDLTQEYFVEHDQLQKDEKKTAKEYIQKAYDDDGSIFEDNFYSQLIRQLIQQLKGQGKQTILIIDDTDRMDPEHIFRILNVFAAHFDAPEYRNGDSNKFGFDKIIIVCDYDNLHKIFCHKYGPSTDFAGYIDKFFSKKIFKYDNTKAIKESIYSIIPEDKKNYLPNFDLIISDLIRLNCISLREVLKVKKNNPVVNAEYFYRNVPYSTLSTIHVLTQIFNLRILIDKTTSCKNRITDIENLRSKQPVFHYSSLELIKEMIQLNHSGNIDENKRYEFFFKNKNYEFNVKRTFHGYTISEPFLNGNLDNQLFSAQDFYELLLLAIEKYEQLILSE